MKKIILTLAVFGLIGLTSCNKDKNCNCTKSFSGTGSEGMADEEYDQELLNSGGDCASTSSTTNADGLVTTITCE